MFALRPSVAWMPQPSPQGRVYDVSKSEYPVASVLLRNTEQMTLAVGARQYLYEQRFLWGDFAAAAILSGMPITILFLMAQRFLVSDLGEGAVKG